MNPMLIVGENEVLGGRAGKGGRMFMIKMNHEQDSPDLGGEKTGERCEKMGCDGRFGRPEPDSQRVGAECRMRCGFLRASKA